MRCIHPLPHHSRFVQLSGLLPTDRAAQEHELLCRAIELGLTFDQLQGAELSCFELLARRSQMPEMKLRDKKSVRRYEKHARLLKETSKLSIATHEKVWTTGDKPHAAAAQWRAATSSARVDQTGSQPHMISESRSRAKLRGMYKHA